MGEPRQAKQIPKVFRVDKFGDSMSLGKEATNGWP